MTKPVQQCKQFFNPDGPYPTHAEIMAYLDSPECPLNRIVVSNRNRPAMEGLRTYAYNALLRPDHSCQGMNFGFYCGPGQGKSYTVSCWAQTVGLPFIDVPSDGLESTWQLFERIAAKLQEEGLPLIPTFNETTYCLPPCIVFFDEAQSLSKELRTGAALLTAMELNTGGWLQTSPPGKGQRNYLIDCQHVCWVAASTDPGDIYAQSEAFHSRFSQHVVWYPAGAEEVSLIVGRKYPHFPREACDIVSKYVLMPRKAIAFARLMEMRKRMNNGTWEEAARQVAEINAIDEWGMEEKQVRVLRALGQSPVARSNMHVLAGCRPAELEKIILPPLFDTVEGRGQLLRPTHKGFAITRAGLKELDKRSIPHKGDRVTAESIEGL